MLGDALNFKWLIVKQISSSRTFIYEYKICFIFICLVIKKEFWLFECTHICKALLHYVMFYITLYNILILFMKDIKRCSSVGIIWIQDILRDIQVKYNVLHAPHTTNETTDLLITKLQFSFRIVLIYLDILFMFFYVLESAL